MSLFNWKKRKGHYNMLTDNYVPASLPSYGMALETFVVTEYRMNKPEEIAKLYEEGKERLGEIVATCDHHSVGSECDAYIENATAHNRALHQSEIAEHENQITRIQTAFQMRKEDLKARIEHLKQQIERLTAEIQPLEGLRSQFQIHVGRHAFSIALPITVIAMIVDAFVNMGYLQSILLSNVFMLAITVIGMSVASDLSMWALGTFLSHKEEKFTSKPVFYLICSGLLAMFLLSVVASVMIRYGSMDSTFGTINASGEFVGKESYSLAEYGVTLITAFVTTATGLLSFCFSLDANAYLVSVREQKKKERERASTELQPLLNELSLLEGAPDPRERDESKRAAAERQIEALRTGLKLYLRKLMALQIKDPNFTEKMGESGARLCAEEASRPVAPAISLEKAV